ncbi:MAG: tetratricopeptide repeat protein [Methylococcales bacterium]
MMETHLLNAISAYLNQGDFTEALKLLHKAEKLHINDSQYWEMLALTHGMSGNNAGCKNACLTAIKLNPKNVGTYINLGVAQQNLGLMDEAEKTLKKALSMDNSHAQINNNLGALYIIQAEYHKAKPYIEKAISVAPAYSDAYSNLGEIQKYFQETDSAIKSYQKSIKLNPSNVNSYLGLGSLYSYEGNYDKAEYYLNHAIRLNPYHAESVFNMGFLHYLKKSYNTASQYFIKTTELNPDHQNAKYLLSAITGNDSPEKSPEIYIKGLFDHYAETFDEHLITDLGYNVPASMHLLFTRHANPEQTKNLLDLGCGTGLCGDIFHDMYEHLTGIDLSEKMTAKANEKNVYDELHVEDILKFTNESPTYYDLVIAADVFIYIGEVSEIINAIHNKQNKHGYFIFSIEKSNKHNAFHLRETGRYSHNENYIKSILDQTTYNIITTHCSVIRNEKGNGIEGVIFLCQK